MNIELEGKVIWSGLHWAGSTVVIMASGPSITPEQCDLVRDWHAGAERGFAIAVNTTFRLAPWADVLYACDAAWWTQHHAEAAQMFHGEHWTQDMKARHDFAINRIESIPGCRLSKKQGVISQGGNGGFQAVNLAYQAGAKRIVLLGFDMRGSHWHGAHPRPMTNPRPDLFNTWIYNFGVLANDLLAEGVEVINCSPGSALKCFKVADLLETLAAAPCLA